MRFRRVSGGRPPWTVSAASASGREPLVCVPARKAPATRSTSAVASRTHGQRRRRGGGGSGGGSTGRGRGRTVGRASHPWSSPGSRPVQSGGVDAIGHHGGTAVVR